MSDVSIYTVRNSDSLKSLIFHTPDKSSANRTQQIDIYDRFDVAVSTAVADSMKHNKKRKAA